MAVALRRSSLSSLPQQTTCATEYVGSSARPMSAHAWRTRSIAGPVVARVSNTLNSSANRAASDGVRRGPVPPTISGMRPA